MTKDEIVSKYRQYLFSSVTTYFTDPLVTDHASMQYLWDVDGKKYLDFFGGIVTVSVGHCNPRVTSKIKEQIDKLQHGSTVFPNEAIVVIAEKLAQITPARFRRRSSPTAAPKPMRPPIQLARVHTGNFEIVALRHGYSGRSQLAQGLTGHAPWRKSLPGPSASCTPSTPTATAARSG